MKIFTMTFFVLRLLLVCNFFLGVVVGEKTSTSSYMHLERRLAVQQWCIAKPNLGNSFYQGALDWVCGPLSGQGQVNCAPITAGQSCFLPDTYQSHCSWAFNVYYQTHGQTTQSCDFQGTAVITTTDPSTSTCPYTASTNTSSGGFNGTSGAMGDSMMYPWRLSWLSAVVYLLTAQAL